MVKRSRKRNRPKKDRAAGHSGSEFRRWTSEGEIDAAAAMAKALRTRPGCRRAALVMLVATLAWIVVALTLRLLAAIR